jgi:FkbM family methyltransferase
MEPFYSSDCKHHAFLARPKCNQTPGSFVFSRRLFCVELKEPKGLRIRGRYREHADLYAIKEVYLDRVYNLDSLSVNPSTIIDAGAHLGTFSLLAHRRFPGSHIVAIEPDPGNFDLLISNLSLNNANIETHQCALSDYEGAAFLAGPTSMGRRIDPLKGNHVTVRRLKSLINFGTVERLLLKIDIEGAEWAVLNDSVSELPTDALIYVELHDNAFDLERIRQFASVWQFYYEITTTKSASWDAVLRRGNFESKSIAHSG